ncbi:MAG: universal stress protein [Ancalomicrobiaceae bacterium]|nr:universal stress protein [Ancalomicrobiaceae bacterium]
MFHKILVPVDPQDVNFAAKAVEHAARFAKECNGTVRLIAVSPVLTGYVTEFLPSDFQKEVDREAEDKLDVLKNTALAVGGKAEVVIRLGSVYTEVVEEAKDWGADLIVVSSHQPKLTTYLIGSNAAQIVRHARCSVLVLRE